VQQGTVSTPVRQRVRPARALTVRELDDGTSLQLWDDARGEPVGDALPAPAGAQYVRTTAFSDDRRALVSVYDTGEAVLWDVDPRRWVARACRILAPLLKHPAAAMDAGQEAKALC